MEATSGSKSSDLGEANMTVGIREVSVDGALLAPLPLDIAVERRLRLKSLKTDGVFR